MLERIRIAGSGGQGIILSGKLLASAAVKSVEHVTFFPSYGAEVRGGTSNCQVILSGNEIASPVSDVVDTMVILNQASIDRFITEQTEPFLLIVNTSLCQPKPCAASEVVGINASDLAVELGDVRSANFIMLGAYYAQREIVPLEDMEDGIKRLLLSKGQKVVDLNLRAFHTGRDRAAPLNR